MDLRKTKYILPNLFTLASVFAGLYSIVTAANAVSARDLTVAAWLIVVSMLMDGLDGRVARLTRTESEFGVQLDSLADAIAFGVAPGFLVYRWGLESLGWPGLLVAFAYVACGIMRLARFNVLAARSHDKESPVHFTGLPIPLAAGSLVSVVLAHVATTGRIHTPSSLNVAVLCLVLAGLMVSNVSFRTFKKVRVRGKRVILMMVALVAVVIACIRFNPGIVMASLMVAYVIVGITESSIAVRRRRRLHRSQLATDDPDQD
jgi:CDP-diacylglycerol--serine O-phosphatidyltransferase